MLGPAHGEVSGRSKHAAGRGSTGTHGGGTAATVGMGQLAAIICRAEDRSGRQLQGRSAREREPEAGDADHFYARSQKSEGRASR